MDNEAELIQGLQAPVKSFRLYALERLIREGGSPAVLAVLQNLEASETDEECLGLLDHALTSVQGRLKTGSGVAVSPAVTAEAFPDRFASASSGERLRLLQALDRRAVGSLAPLAPSWLEKETDPSVSSALVRVFGRSWPKTELNALSSRLLSDRLSLRIACLEALIRLAPVQLAKALPQLLTAEDPRTRALAIGGLAAIDLDEALLHLEALLLGETPHGRLAGLQNAFLLPIERVKPLLLKYLAAEQDAGLLEKAGWILQSNPDLETPFRLWEVTEQAPPAKAAVLQKVLTELCRVIREARLAPDHPAYMERLQTWIRRRNAIRFVQRCLARLGERDAGPDPELEATLVASLQRPEVRSAFTEALTWPVPEPLKDRLRQYLKVPGTPQTGAGSPPPAPATGTSPEEPRRADRTAIPGEGAASPAGVPTPVSGAGPTPDTATEPVSHEALVRTVATWKPADLERVRPRLESFLSEPGTPADLRATSFRTAVRLGVKGFAAQAEAGLNHSDGNLTAAAIDYLAANDADRLFPHLGRLLKSGGGRVKAAALKTLAGFDPVQALSRLEAMLRAQNRDQRLQTLSCMVHFDFSLVRDRLAAFLEGHPDPDLLEAGLCLFAANPDPDNLYPLFHLERGLPAHLQSKVRAVSGQTTAVLQSEGRLTAENVADLGKTHEARWQMEEVKRQAPLPAYSLKRLQAEGVPQGWRKWPALARELVAGTWTRAAISSVLVFTVIAGLVWGRAPEKLQALFSAERITVSGRITSQGLEPGEVVLRTEESRYLIDVGPGRAGEVPVGTQVQATLVPFRQLPEGVIIARLEDLEVTAAAPPPSP